MRVGLAFPLTVLLVACGGGGSGADGDDVVDPGDLTASERLVAFDDMNARLAGLFNTGYTGQPGEVPSDGSASFVGFGGISLVRAGDDLGLLGIAELEIDFGTRVLTGQIDRFIGDDGGTLEDWSGTVAIRNGEVGFDVPRGDTVPNDIRFDYAGTLTGQGNTVILYGAAEGKLKGTPIQGLSAVTTGETEFLNGAETPTTIVVIAETP